MTSLLELQRAFARAILKNDDSNIAGLILSDNFAGGQRLNVYRNNVLESLIGALGDVYPVVARLVGDDFFRQSAREYLSSYPLRTGTLLEFGGMFPRFLDSMESVAHLPYLADVARLEWAWHEVFHAASAPAFSPESLRDMDAEGHERLRFRLNPASRLLTSQYPVLRIWEVNQPEHLEVDVVRLDEGGDDLLVLRAQMEVRIHRLEGGEYAFLSALASGDELGRACEVGCSVVADFDPGRALARHVTIGTIVDVQSAAVSRVS